jgi:aminomethyltransferase
MEYTPLNKVHIALGAKMKEFAGYYMPIEYTGINSEHMAVREKVGIFDISHMGEFWLKGEGATDLLQKITVSDINKLNPGKIQYTCFPNGNGGIVDDFMIYKINKNEYMIVVNAANIKKDWDWVNKNNNFMVNIADKSKDTALLAIQGPESFNTIQKLVDFDLNEIKPFHFKIDAVADVDNVLISRTGYTGEKGFELYFDQQHGEYLWHKIMDAGQEFGIKPIGLGARDTLRLEAGLCLYGKDIDDTTSAIEAGLGWIVKFNDGNAFIDRDYLYQQKNNGIKQRLVGFEMQEKGIPRHNYLIIDQDGKTTGRVTSGTMSPLLKKGIGMGYVDNTLANIGQDIYIKIRKKTAKAKIVKFPLHRNHKDL